jgi:PAS domain S-box-containing protein
MIYRRGDGTRTTFSVNAAPIRDANGQVIAVVSTFLDIEPRRQLELELREAESRFAAAFKASPVAKVISTMADGRIVDANERFLTMFGRTRADIIGQPSTTIGMWDKPSDRVRALEKLREDGSLRDWEVVVRGAGDERRHVLLSVEKLEIAGTPCLLTGLYDITDRVRAEAALNESQQFAQAILNSSASGIYVWDLDSNNAVFVNEQYARITGHQLNEIDALSGREALSVHPDDLPLVFAHMEQVRSLPDGQTLEVEYRYRRADGAWIWCSSINAVFRRSQDGIAHQAIGSLTDITLRKTQEEQLRRSEQRFGLFIAQAPAAVAMFDREMRYLAVSQRWLQDFGIQQDIIGRDHYKVFPEIPERWKAIHRRALAGAVERSEEDRFVRADGTVEWLRWEVRPWYDPAGAIGGIVIFSEDITARKRLEAQLLQSQKMESIGQLAGGIAHDFNNLLTAIGGYAELALADLPAEASLRADLTEIQHATNRATALTRQLLSFARRQRMEMRSLNLNELATNLEKLLRRLIGEHIQLVTQLQPNLGHVVGDHGQIEQVLINLAVNARDAMPDGGTLSITTRNFDLDTRFGIGQVDLPAGAYVLVTVSDTGVGIPPEHQKHLFEPFFTTKPIGQGTGLGLATSYGIVKQHGGAIWIYSEVGHGTIVKIYLPRDTEILANQQQEQVTAPLPGGSETVLLVEDEPAVRTLAARVLRECGYIVLEAADGTEAVRQAEAHLPQPIHLLLSDVVMPLLSGPVAAAQIQSIYPSIRMLFISGYPDLIKAPVDTVALDARLIQKPFSPADLAAAVRAALDC